MFDYTINCFNCATNRCFCYLPYLIPNIKVFLEFEGVKERLYHKIVWLQILKTFIEKKIPPVSYAGETRGVNISVLSNTH